METVNSLSGGKTSSYIAMHYPADYNVFSLVCIDDPECTPKDKSVIDYVNTKLAKYADRYGEFIATTEDDATIVAMMDLEQLMGREIIWVRGKSFDDIIDLPGGKGKRTRLPNLFVRYCTEELKIVPIFEWWFNKIGQKVEMRIGYRFEEYGRMERFMNNSNPTNFSIPVSCSTRGERKQKWGSFNWRYCSFPLVRDGITNDDIKQYWKRHGWIAGNFFTEPHRIHFPEVSNCVGCFHKKPDTLSIMANLHPEKMNWFAKQENKGMGTWLDSKIPYQTIIDNAKDWIPEMLKETGAACDSGGCHD